MQLFLRLVLILNVVLALPIFIIRAQPRPEQASLDLPVSIEDCLQPCFLGIRPGVTTVDEAMSILQSHEWVQSVQLRAAGNGYGQIRWGWSGLQTALIDDSYEGRITFYWEEDDPINKQPGTVTVDTLLLHTRLRMHDAQTWFGAPDSGTITIDYFDDHLQYSAAYHRRAASLRLSTTVACPATWMSYWNARVDLMLTIGHGSSTYLEPPDILRLC